MHKHEGILVIAFLPDSYPHSEVLAELDKLGVAEEFTTKVTHFERAPIRLGYHGYAAKVNRYDEALDLLDTVFDSPILCCAVFEKADHNPWVIVK